MLDRHTAAGLGRQIGTLFDLGALGTMPDRSLLDQLPRGRARPRRRLPHSSSDTGHWSCGFAGMFWPMVILPRMPFR